jgi:hypothetical protein
MLLASATNENFNFDSSKFTSKINKCILDRFSKTNPYFAGMWQYFLISCNYQDSDYWLSSFKALSYSDNRTCSSRNKNNAEQSELSDNSSVNNHSLNHEESSTKKNPPRSKDRPKTRAKSSLSKIKTLNETLFKQLSLTIYCDYLTNDNQLDSTTGLTMLIINNLVELFELVSCEPSVLDLFSTIHRNAYASNLFIHSINLKWSHILSKKRLTLLHSVLKSLEAVHLSSSGQLLNLIIDKYFHLPYLSLVRYADQIACQRVEMLQSLPAEELLKQLNEQNMIMLTSFFGEQFKYSYRHKRLISLLDLLKKNIDNVDNEQNESENNVQMTTSPSTLGFFMLYTSINDKSPSEINNLDKEWFYNMVRSACSINSNNMVSTTNQNLKSKQCALMLSNLDKQNILSILQDKTFNLSILKECLVLGAHKSQFLLDKLPKLIRNSRLTNLEHLQADFMHPLWIAATNFLFASLKDLSCQLPKHQIVSLHINTEDDEMYEKKLDKTILDFDLQINPIAEAINVYLKCIHDYPILYVHNSEENQSSLVVFAIFQLEYVNFLNKKTRGHKAKITFSNLHQTLSCIFNLLIDQEIQASLCSRTDYSTLVSTLIKNFYELVQKCFLKQEESLILTPKTKIVYNNYTSDILFTPNILNLMLKLRFIFTSHRSAIMTHSNASGSELNNTSNSTAGDKRSSSKTLHTFLQQQHHYIRDKIPFNLRDLCEKIYLNLSRLPILDRFMRIPDSLWKLAGSEFSIEFTQLLKNDSSNLPPLDYLRDPLILKDHLRHILSVGWTSRAQFEYEYVNLLTLLHNLSEDYYAPMSTHTLRENLNLSDSLSLTSSSDTETRIMNLPSEEIRERNKAICLVIKGLSSWLIKSSLAPKSGNSLNSLYEQVGRNKIPNFLSSQLGRKYSQIKKIIDAFSRSNQFNRSQNSVFNNENLSYMLDPVLINEFDSKHLKEMSTNSRNPPPTSNFVNEKLAMNNLYQISTSLSQRDNFNSMFTINLERAMLANLPQNSDTYFYFTQVSLEGLLKFLGQCNRSILSNNRYFLLNIG